jgi:hypothetical protein
VKIRDSIVANDAALGATGEAVAREMLLSGGRAQPRITTAVRRKLAGDLIGLI